MDHPFSIRFEKSEVEILDHHFFTTTLFLWFIDRMMLKIHGKHVGRLQKFKAVKPKVSFGHSYTWYKVEDPVTLMGVF
jgi:hypothetical protein